MKETPVNKIMENTLEKMREMVDVSTIIGDEQGRAVQNLFATCKNVQVRQDIYGKDRILIATVA